MPLAWKIDPENRLMVARGEGFVTRAEMERYLDAIVQNDALAYRKVFDVHRADTSMTADDVLPLAVRMRALHTLGPMGPLAVVLPAGRGKRLERALGMLAAAENRAMQVFENPVLSWRWIARQDLPLLPDDRGAAKGTLKWRTRARELTVRVKGLAQAAGDEARRLHLDAPPDELLYRGQADITHRGVPLNVCVRQVGAAWEFMCCDPDRRALGTLATLAAEEIAASRAQGEDPLAATLGRLKTLAQAGRLAVPDTPNGRY